MYTHHKVCLSLVINLSNCIAASFNSKVTRATFNVENNLQGHWKTELSSIFLHIRWQASLTEIS